MENATILANALRDNTKAVRANTAAINKLGVAQDKETSLVDRRKTLLAGVPYTEDQLLAFKRQDLVMLAAQLKITDTSVPQNQLVQAVLDAQLQNQSHQTRRK